MQTIATNVNTLIVGSDNDEILDSKNRAECLKAVYTQLFKENRDLDFFHNSATDSAYLKGKLTMRQLVCELLKSEMYRDYILLVNSNYRFVSLCFERVLGRPATDTEVMSWSSFLATAGLASFAEKLTNSDEYMTAFGDNKVPTRRSKKLSTSKQGLPALPESASIKRYDGSGREGQYYGGTGGSLFPWDGNLPPKPVRQVAAVLTVAGAIEVVRLLITIAGSALSTESL